MASPTVFTQLMSLFGKAEAQQQAHAQAASNHTRSHIDKRDAERNDKAAAKRAGTHTNTSR